MEIYSAKYDEFIGTFPNRKEIDLQNFLIDKWDRFFPYLSFVKSEFEINAKTRSEDDRTGRFDILAFNPKTNCFVIFELKRDRGKNITHQVADYASAFLKYIKTADFLQKISQYEILPEYEKLEKNKIELVLIDTMFSETNIEHAKENIQNKITLIKYRWLDLYHHNIFKINSHPIIPGTNEYVIGLEYLNKENEPKNWKKKSDLKNIFKRKELQKIEKEKLNKQSKSVDFILNWWENLHVNLKREILINKYFTLNEHYIYVEKDEYSDNLLKKIFGGEGIYKELREDFHNDKEVSLEENINFLKELDDEKYHYHTFLQYIKEHNKEEYNIITGQDKVNNTIIADIFESIEKTSKLIISDIFTYYNLKPLYSLHTLILKIEVTPFIVAMINESNVKEVIIESVIDRDNLLLLKELKLLDKLSFFTLPYTGTAAYYDIDINLLAKHNFLEYYNIEQPEDESDFMSLLRK